MEFIQGRGEKRNERMRNANMYIKKTRSKYETKNEKKLHKLVASNRL